MKSDPTQTSVRNCQAPELPHRPSPILAGPQPTVASPTSRVFVDECVGPTSRLVDLFKEQVAGARQMQFLLLAKLHRAIPDVEILTKVLDENTILLTADRVLHNRTLDGGFASYTLDLVGQLSRKRQPLAQTKDAPPRVSKAPLKSDYVHLFNPVASAFKMDLPERAFQRYKTRRRRIRSYFGSAENIGNVALTIGCMVSGDRIVCGYFLALASLSGVKGLRASEGYGSGQSGETAPSFCVLHALREIYLLQLETVPVELYLMPSSSFNLCQHLVSAQEAAALTGLRGFAVSPCPAAGSCFDPVSRVEADSSDNAVCPGQLCEIPPVRGQARPARIREDGLTAPDEVLQKVLAGLSHPKVMPCLKGRFFDAMNSKLQQMARGRSNELVQISFTRLVNNLRQRFSEDATSLPPAPTTLQATGL